MVAISLTGGRLLIYLNSVICWEMMKAAGGIMKILRIHRNFNEILRNCDEIVTKFS